MSINISPDLPFFIGVSSFVVYLITLSIIMLYGLMSPDRDPSKSWWAALNFLCAIVMPICAYMVFEHTTKIEQSFENAKPEQVQVVDAEKKSGGKTTYWLVTVRHIDTGLEHQMPFHVCAGDWPYEGMPVNIVRSTEGQFSFPGCRENPYNSLANIWKYWWFYTSALLLSLLGLARLLHLPSHSKSF